MILIIVGYVVTVAIASGAMTVRNDSVIDALCVACWPVYLIYLSIKPLIIGLHNFGKWMAGK